MLAAYVDGTLDADARARVEAHIATCEDCYEALVELTRLQNEMALTPVNQPVSPVARRASESPALRPRRIKWGLVGLAAAILFLVAAGLIWLRGLRSSVQ